MSILNFLPFMIIFVGGYFLIKLKMFYVLHPIRTLKFTFSGKNRKEDMKSLLLALAGTLGVGNIIGVAAGLAAGGSGSVFWLVVSALFSSAIKYSEVRISAKSEGSGMIGAVKSSGGVFSHLSYVYALAALLLTFAMGSFLQANAIRDASGGGAAYYFLLVPLTLLFVSFVTLFGKERIKGAVLLTVPFATVLYTGMCLTVIICEIDRLPQVLSDIITNALSPNAISGGIIGFALQSGLREGFLRGLLSNEAGAGTSSFSHTSHIYHSPTEDDIARAGIYGILEVLFDTLLLCPMTALTLLLGSDKKIGGTVAELSEIFERYIGHFAPPLLFFSVFAFAISTVLCWYYYGRVSLLHFTRRYGWLYFLLYFASLALGLSIKIPSLILLNDVLLFTLTLITLSTLIIKRKEIKSPEALDESEDK